MCINKYDSKYRICRLCAELFWIMYLDCCYDYNLLMNMNVRIIVQCAEPVVSVGHGILFQTSMLKCDGGHLDNKEGII